MPPNNRSNPLALAVLSCLYERPMHPYEVAQTLRHRAKHESIRLLDAGAGVGSLTAAFIEEMCGRSVKPRRICATAYEIDPGSRLISLTRCVNAKGLARTLASNLNPS